MKRSFDVCLSITLLTLLALPMLCIALLVKITSRGPALYWSERVGRYNTSIRMPKYRTMKIDAPAVATHLLEDPARYVTPLGSFLRRSSIDELPQLYSIAKGDMSFVGPRPALFNQEDLVELRTKRGIHELVPGLTGWAQINGRDEMPIAVKVEYDDYYRKHRSMLFDLRILLSTFVKVLRKEGVSH